MTGPNVVAMAGARNHGLREYTFHVNVAMAMKHFPWLHFHMDGEGDYQRLSTHMRTLLVNDGVLLDAIYHCPHHPSAGVGAYRRDCECRKPRPGMLLAAAPGRRQ